jgi:hypothetical protein
MLGQQVGTVIPQATGAPAAGARTEDRLRGRIRRRLVLQLRDRPPHVARIERAGGEQLGPDERQDVEVLGPGRRLLRGHEIGRRTDHHGEVVGHRDADRVPVPVVEVPDAVGAVHDLQPAVPRVVGGPARADHGDAGVERAQRRVHGPAVGLVDRDRDVDVLRRPAVAVQLERHAADQDEPDVVVDQRAQERPMAGVDVGHAAARASRVE